jgi:hypothetical protein
MASTDLPEVVLRNIDDRKAAEDLHRLAGEILRDAIAALPSDRSRQIFFEMLKATAEKNLPAAAPTRNTIPHPLTEASSLDADADEAITLVDEIRELADQVPDRGREFAESVLERAKAIGESIERSGRATEKQLAALENMLAGLEAWVHE